MPAFFMKGLIYELMTKQEYFVEALVVIVVGSFLGGEDVNEPPDSKTVAGDDLKNTHANVVQEEAFPTQQDGNNEDKCGFLKLQAHQGSGFVVVDCSDLVLNLLRSHDIETLSILNHEGLYVFGFHRCCVLNLYKVKNYDEKYKYRGYRESKLSGFSTKTVSAGGVSARTAAVRESKRARSSSMTRRLSAIS